MSIEFFEKLVKSKWLAWAGVLPFVCFPLFEVLEGELAYGVGISVFMASPFLAVFFCGKLGAFIAEHIFQANEIRTSKIVAASNAFGFLFLPVLAGIYTNAHFGTDIVIESVGTHFFGSCAGAAIFYCVSPTTK